MRQINQTALNLIKKSEAFRANPYLCPANVPTIGYGTTVYPDGKKVSLKDATITEPQAEALLLHDVGIFSKAVEDSVRVVLNDNQFGALVSLCYNIGSGAFKSSTLLKKLNAGNYQEAAEQFLKWVHGGGKVLPGLVKRREAERSLFLHPVQ